jgi:hypothetical protein
MNLISLIFAVPLSPFVFCFQPNRVHISRHLTCTPSSPLTCQRRLETTNIDATTSNDNDNESTTTSAVVRTPWDVLRFISQSSKFVQSPFASFSRKSTMKPTVIKPGEILWTPTSSSSSFLRFAPLDDVVMGGASYSTIDNNTGIWCGYVTDANNGWICGYTYYSNTIIF